jgi:hypothetical protein
MHLTEVILQIFNETLYFISMIFAGAVVLALLKAVEKM